MVVRVPKHRACAGSVRSWACLLVQEGGCEGLSAAGGLQLLKGQLQKRWSQTLLASVRQENKGCGPCLVSWEDQLGCQEDVFSTRRLLRLGVPTFGGFQACWMQTQNCWLRSGQRSLNAELGLLTDRVGGVVFPAIPTHCSTCRGLSLQEFTRYQQNTWERCSLP